jgi:hypothetical protein
MAPAGCGGAEIPEFSALLRYFRGQITANLSHGEFITKTGAAVIRYPHEPYSG